MVVSFRFRQKKYKRNFDKHAKDESVKQQPLYGHFILEDYTKFLDDASVIFIDMADPIGKYILKDIATKWP